MKKFLLGMYMMIVLGAPIVLAQQPGNQPSSQNVGISCSPEQLTSGTCKYNFYQTLGIRQNTNQDPTSVGLFIQDIILSLTSFIGTILTVSLIAAGLYYIRSGVTGNDNAQSKAKNGIMYAFIGLLLVMGAYAIIRLVQFVVRGG